MCKGNESSIPSGVSMPGEDELSLLRVRVQFGSSKTMFGPDEALLSFRGGEELEDRELLRVSLIVLYPRSKKRHVKAGKT
jgi:hypothetical protein